MAGGSWRLREGVCEGLGLVCVGGKKRDVLMLLGSSMGWVNSGMLGGEWGAESDAREWVSRARAGGGQVSVCWV